MYDASRITRKHFFVGGRRAATSADAGALIGFIGRLGLRTNQEPTTTTNSSGGRG